MERHYKRILKDNDDRVTYSLRTQERDPKSPFYGGFYDDNRIVQAKHAIYQVAWMVSAYCNEESSFYRSEKVYNSISLGLDYIKSVQHENGLFDYITCNFNSAPDTAFCIEKLIPVLEYLRGKETTTLEENSMKEKIEDIVRAGTFGLLEGGFHTPNHRWAIASILVKGSQLFQEESLKEAAFQYLNEGIDGNEDGEYAEKSAGNYNSVNNDAMIVLSEVLEDDTYDQYVIRNLELMLTYWEPDGSIFTANSTRFDKDLLTYPLGYYLEYLKMGMKYDIPLFLEMCNRIFNIIEEKRISAPDILIYYMLHPEYRSLEFEGSYIPTDFKKLYNWSGIYRSRQGESTVTLMREKSDFLYFHNGTIKLSMKVAGSFCEHRAFKSETIKLLEDGTVHLHQTMKGWYYLPFKEKPATSDWWEMENDKRDKKLGPNMEIDVYVRHVEGGVDVQVKTHGVKGAPWRIELALNGIDYLDNEHVTLPVNGSEVLVIRDGFLEAYNKQDSLLIGPCFGTHRFTEGKEDSEAKTPGAATVYFTDYTEFDHIISIRNKKDCEK